MKTRVLLVLFISGFVLCQHETKTPEPNTDKSRVRRNAAGALHIVTNHAQPIHADVKADNEVSETPCPEGQNRPSHIESGVGFQVTPPENGVFEMKSLRKSLHLAAHPTQNLKLTTTELVRRISRYTTFIVIFITAVFEFFTIFSNLVKSLRRFIFNE